MKPSERKQQLVNELSSLYENLNVNRLYAFPNQKDTQQWLADVASVLKNLDETDYQEIIRLSKTVGLSVSREERKKAAQEINQFLGRKIAEWRRYDFSSLDNEDNSPKLAFGEAGGPGQLGGGGSIFINGQVVNITDSARISADGGSSHTTYGNNSPIILNLGKIEGIISQLETEIEQNYKASDKEEIKTIVNELKISAKEGNESRFKKLGGVLLTRGAEIAQIASLVIQLLALSSAAK
ncbi:MAG: hypothetical protein UT84_C0003G0018 [Candidatus Curtissbacteria bacterium GW2011_GWA1_40_16]|uniref:Uncharacterized protein n=1 Tax=Candidatus Curtissbacteria bacterium GW2011_GWA1_40_16 TaxID=1618405 RepID=A0A0G0REZ7_9BACT|nr:MAG: hypothetical protein UT84_C0003G0018 [Candidatus Curtissbacteria bacterium GW2011_GWA1_40_16]